MKKLMVICLSFFLIFPVSLKAQEEKVEKKTEETKKASTEVKVGAHGAVEIVEEGDTVKIKIGNKGLQVVESEEGTKVDILQDEEEVTEEKPLIRKRRRKFNAHWKGFSLGMNNYVNAEGQLGPLPDDDFMDLNTGKSWGVSIQFAQLDVGLIGNSLGLVTGVGIDFNDYRFDGNNNIQKTDNVIVEKDYSPLTLDKTKLTTTYFSIPLLLELQIPAGSKRIHAAGGVIGSVKIGSHTKVVYRDSGAKQKDKIRDDFNLSPLRYGFTGRIGYGDFSVFANYFMIPLFEKNKGPELYPFTIGITFNF
ncbi:MAG TPA: hypothetical protein ENN63_11025 [Bacteroidetes bacterium]|nr:hypothetical protein [Bacteroidota bacterium]